MLDSGFRGNVIDIEFPQNNDTEMANKSSHIDMQTVDCSPLLSGPITHRTIPLQWCRYGVVGGADHTWMTTVRGMIPSHSASTCLLARGVSGWELVQNSKLSVYVMVNHVPKVVMSLLAILEVCQKLPEAADPWEELSTAA